MQFPNPEDKATVLFVIIYSPSVPLSCDVSLITSLLALRLTVICCEPSREVQVLFGLKLRLRKSVELETGDWVMLTEVTLQQRVVLMV